MKKDQIAKCFSNGEFKKCYSYLTEETLWETPGEQTLKGRDAIIPFCEEIRNYFDSITTEFKQINIIENENSVAINGTAKFIRDDQVVSTVSSCDVYTFDEANKIVSIYSYCVKTK